MENLLDKVSKVVVKIGTAGITADSNINLESISNLAKCCYELREKGNYVSIVTSGAIACGRREMNCCDYEGSIAEKQTFAAVGQPLLMQAYINEFDKYHVKIAQFLVSRDDFERKERFDTLYNSFFNTLLKDIIPVFNENDTVATDEIKFSDNDELQALITTRLRQDLMINLIVYDGLLKDGKIVEIASSYNAGDYDNLENEVKEGRGGLQNKLNAIKTVNEDGKICIVGNVKGNLLEVIQGKVTHTRFLPISQK